MTDANKVVARVTAGWAKSLPRPHLASTFSRLPKEFQDSVKKEGQSKAKGIFHPETNSIWVILDKHNERADAEGKLDHWGTLVALGKVTISALDGGFYKLGGIWRT